MKNVMKLLVVAILFSMATETYAQKFGVKAGLNLANVLVKDDEDTYSDDFKTNLGYLVGVTAEFPISEMFSFETGALLSTKGFKIEGDETYEGETIDMKVKTSLFYLDIPLTAKAYFGSGDTKFYGAFGPYIGIGLSGKMKAEASYMGESESEEEDIKFGSGDDEVKRLDYGLMLGAGVQINSIQLGLSYGLGLANLSNVSEGGYKENNRVLGISVGYTFGE